jgi:fructoselysine-6-P-deglycase FrlB-like protein
MNPADIQTYIQEQPAVLRRVLEEVPPAVGKMSGFLDADWIYLVGSGTSRNALLAASPLLAKTVHRPVQVKGPLSFMEEVWEAEKGLSVAIILSQTGTSTTTIQAVEHSRRLGMRTITLTAEPESPIVHASSEILVVPAGPEPVGPKTKGYSACVLTLLLLAAGAEGGNVGASPFFDSYGLLIEESRQVMRTMAESSRETDHFLVMGQERHYATALEGALKITEMSGVPAAAFETEEAFHGRFHGLSSKSRAIFISASPEQQEMAAAGAGVLSELGVGVTIFNLSGGLPSPFDLRLPWPPAGSWPELDLLSVIVPFQYLGWHLAKEKGIIPGKMRYPGLSQKLKIKTRVGA